MQFKQMFVTAVFFLFLLKLKWPKSKNFNVASVLVTLMSIEGGH